MYNKFRFFNVSSLIRNTRVALSHVVIMKEREAYDAIFDENARRAVEGVNRDSVEV